MSYFSNPHAIVFELKKEIARIPRKTKKALQKIGWSKLGRREVARIERFMHNATDLRFERR